MKLTHMLFQTCMIFLLLWNIKEDILKNAALYFVYTMKVNEVQCYLWQNFQFRVYCPFNALKYIYVVLRMFRHFYCKTSLKKEFGHILNISKC